MERIIKVKETRYRLTINEVKKINTFLEVNHFKKSWLSDKLDITPELLSSYMNGGNSMPEEVAKKLMECGIFEMTLKDLITFKGYNVASFSNKCGVSRRTVQRYITRDIYPKLDIAMTMANCLKVSVDDIANCFR